MNNNSSTMLGFLIMTLSLVSLSVSTDNCKNGKSEDCSSVTAAKRRENFNQEHDWDKATSIYQFHAKDIRGQDVSLEKYRGHVLVVVNVASNCGLTDNNYKQLEALYEKFGSSKDLRILAFPSNEFGGQEPGKSSDILNFIKKYNVQFDMFEKIEVNGSTAHPIWKWLKKHAGGFITDHIKWNFSKFIIDKQGQVVSRFSPTTEPFALEETLQLYF